MTRRLVPTAFALTAVFPALAQAQGPVIDHKPIGCIVAGHFPKLNACFTPAADVARGRVYFKVSAPKPSPHWYWVDFKSDTPCFLAILPKPTKAITEMSYYVEVADKKFQEARTGDRPVKIVATAGECDKDVPVAGWVDNASVVVGAPAGAPAVPVGFAGTGVAGGGSSLLVPVVIGGGAAAATGIVVASGGGDGDDGGSPTPTPGPAPTAVPPTPTALPIVATPTPTTAPTAPPLPFRAICRVVPTGGSDPLLVTFDCCSSTGTNLRFEYDFDGDGIEDARNVCRTQRIYRLTGVFTPLVTPVTTPTREYTARIVVREALADGGREEQTYRITVEGTAGLTLQPLASSNPARRVSWVADLDGADSAQVILNGTAGVYARRGRSSGAAAGRRGQNRVEIQLVQGGAPGQVRLDLQSMPSFVPGSLRVVAGDLVSLTDNTITFRLKGTAGERIVFTLEAAD